MAKTPTLNAEEAKAIREAALADLQAHWSTVERLAFRSGVDAVVGRLSTH